MDTHKLNWLSSFLSGHPPRAQGRSPALLGHRQNDRLGSVLRTAAFLVFAIASIGAPIALLARNGEGETGSPERALRQAASLMGPVLRERERIKAQVVRQTIDREFPALRKAQRERLAEALYVTGLLRGVDPLLALAVIENESSFDKEAESVRGALGLMQVRPFVGEEVAARIGISWEGPVTLLDPVSNVRIGIDYLGQMKKMFPRAELALAAYNLGPYRLRNLLESAESVPQEYAGRVLSSYLQIQRDYLDALAQAGFLSGAIARVDNLTDAREPG